MKILLSSIGSRGDVQPILALALELRALGHVARLCAAPNFKEWIESYGIECIPIGPDLKKLTGGIVTGKPVLPSKEQLQKLADESVRTQFQVIGEAARGCDLVLAAGALQLATRSIAEARNIPYIFAAYCPAILPSPKYPPAKMLFHHSQSQPEEVIQQLWKEDELEFNVRFGATLNAERAKLGLSPVSSVRSYMFTDHPWLAADATLAPAYPTADMQIFQTGAWFLPDSAPLPDDLEAFLTDGDPPIYFGFGSMRASDQTSRIFIEAARTLGRRAIISQGWANLELIDAAKDCIAIGDVNHKKLFPRVAAIVHHGGAGTTSTAACAGKPQVIIPHNYDQFYWGQRVNELKIGVSDSARDDITANSLAEALHTCLKPEMTTRAETLSKRIELRGAKIAAERLVEDFG